MTGFGESHIMMDEQGNTSGNYFSNINYVPNGKLCHFVFKSCFLWLGIDSLFSMESDPWSSFTPTLYIDINMEMDDLLLVYDLREGEL